MKFRDTLTIILLIFEPFGISGEIKLHPPWVQIIQHVNENYSIKCEGDGEKVWRNPAGQVITTGTSVYTLKKTPENALYLKFNKITKEHKGFYNCSATIKGKKYSKGFELIVIKPVTFPNTTTEIVVNEGSDVVLDCFPDGEPTPDISWFFEDKIINDWSPSSNYHTTQGVSLKISNTSWKNSGTYTCRAFQKLLQTRDAEQVFRLRVRHKPVTPEENIVVYGFGNESRNLTCQVTAYPTAYFIWYRENEPVDPKIHNVEMYNDENISKMEISLTDLSKLGKYDCEAANQMGMQIISVELKLTDKPETPKILVHELLHTSVIVSVQPFPSHDFNCTVSYTEYTYCSYEEKWKKAKSKICPYKKIANTNKTHCTIDNLKPLTKYAVRASIWNQGGSSEPSDELLFRTRKEAPLLLSSATMIKSYLLCFICSVILVI